MKYVHQYALQALTVATAAVAVAAFLAGEARGDDIGRETMPFHSTADAAKVKAEGRAASRAPSVQYIYGRDEGPNYNEVEQFRSAYTPAQARRDYLSSRTETNAFTGEDSGSAYLSRPHPGVDTRAMGAAPR